MYGHFKALLDTTNHLDTIPAQLEYDGFELTLFGQKVTPWVSTVREKATPVKTVGLVETQANQSQRPSLARRNKSPN